MTQFKEKILKFKGHILTALVAVVIGVILGFVFDKPKTEFLAGETITVMKDTCVLDRIIADVITESNTTTSGDIKKGKTQKESSTLPIVETSKQDSIYTTVFSKSYNTGLMRMKVTTTVKAKSQATGKIDMEYELDTLELAKLTTVVNTVVISKDSTDKVPDQIVKYLSVETTPKKMTYLGIGGLVTKNPKTFDYSVGVSLSHGKTSVSLFKAPRTNFKALEGYSIGINRQLIRMSAKK